MTPKRIAGVFEAVSEILRDADANHFVWEKVQRIKTHLFQDQDLAKTLRMVSAFKASPIFGQTRGFDGLQVFLFVSLMECICRYKLGDFEGFLDSLKALKAHVADHHPQARLSTTGWDSTAETDHAEHAESLRVERENLQYLVRQNKELHSLILKYESAIEELVGLESQLHQLSVSELYRYASLVSNFDKRKAVEALCVIVRRDPGWGDQKAVKAATNILSSIKCVDERRPLLRMFNESLERR